jgi:hypothetical protein
MVFSYDEMVRRQIMRKLFKKLFSRKNFWDQLEEKLMETTDTGGNDSRSKKNPSICL